MILLKKLSKQKSSSKKEPKIIELILYSDLVVNDNAKTIAGEVGIRKTNKVYKKAPKKCPDCKCEKVLRLQVLGAINKEIMWICDSCEKLFLKYSFRYTVSKLKKSKSYWTNPNDWEEPEEGDYN